jgi:hypothetical protein
MKMSKIYKGNNFKADHRKFEDINENNVRFKLSIWQQIIKLVVAS